MGDGEGDVEDANDKEEAAVIATTTDQSLDPSQRAEANRETAKSN